MLLYCFAGCGVTDILTSVGLTFSDLFPPRLPSGHEPQRAPRLLTAGQALELLTTEAALVAVAASNVARGVLLSPGDLERLQKAAGRAQWLLAETGGHHVH